jgi:hypothetical protein
MAEQTIAPVKKTNGTLRRWGLFDMFEALQQEMERLWHRPFAFATGPLPAFFQRPTIALCKTTATGKSTTARPDKAR